MSHHREYDNIEPAIFMVILAIIAFVMVTGSTTLDGIFPSIAKLR
jgi:hypothetical protein